MFLPFYPLVINMVLMSSSVAQSLGSAFLLPIAQSVFQNELWRSLRQFAPNLDPQAVVAAGANNEAIPSFPQASQRGIIQSYQAALRSAFVIGVPFAGVALLVSFPMPRFRYYDGSKKLAAEPALGQSEKAHNTSAGVKRDNEKTSG